MPGFKDCWTSTRITWEARHQTAVTIKGSLRPDSRLSPFPFALPLTIIFKRSDFIELLRVPERARLLREDLAAVSADGEDPPPASLLDEQALHNLFYNVAVTVAHDLIRRVTWYELYTHDLWGERIRCGTRSDRPVVSWYPRPQESLPALGPLKLTRIVYPRELFDQVHQKQFHEAVNNPKAVQRLTRAIFETLFPVRLTRLLLTPPRGPTVHPNPLREILPAALAYARLILETATSSEQGCIREIVDENCWYRSTVASLNDDDPPTPKTYIKQVVSVMLVDRAFLGAWERFRLSVDYTQPQEVFRRYCYGRKGAPFRYKSKNTDIETTRKKWGELLLGTPRQAAQAFGLLQD